MRNSKYLQEILSSDEKFINTNFRDKINGWKNALTTTTRAFSIPAREDIFMKAFLENLCLRPSCGECKFNKLPRQADLTIGDFWGIGKYSKKLNDKKGTSVVLVNNEKGKKLLKSVEKDLKILEKVPLKYAINGNHNIVGASIVNPKRKTFMKNLGTKSLADCLKNCYDNSCDFLIVNFWDSNNYGAILTAYAMQELIKIFGYRTKILKDSEQVANRKFQTSVFQKFANRFLDTTTQLTYKGVNKLTKGLKGVIVGSDQVFRLRYIGKSSNKFLLNFVDKDCRKLAILASFGVDKYEYPNSTSFKRLYKKAKKSLSSFDFLSCREFSGTEIYKDIFGLNSDVIIDPVFLIAKEQYDEILNVSNVDYTDKVVSYILDYNEEYYDFEKRFGIDAVKLNNSGEPVNVEDWVNAIKSCKFLITDSFHGACFAIIFNKPFICLTNKSRGIARFDTLRELTGIEKNFVSSLNDVESLSENIDYNAVNIALNKEKERCLTLLEQVINNDYSNNKCKIEYVYNKKFNLRKYSEYVFYRTLRLFIKTQKIKDKIANAKYAIDWRS